MLKQRIITALAMLPVVIYGLFFLESWGYALFTGAIMVVAAWEWAGLAGIKGQLGRCGYALLMACLMFAFVGCFYPDLGMGLFSSVLASDGYFKSGLLRYLLFLALLWWGYASVQLIRGKNFPSNKVSTLLMGLMVLFLAWVALQFFSGESGKFFLIPFLIVVWSADIGAYFVGRRWGKHKLAPKISPGKTWEGVMGGAALALLLTLILFFILNTLEFPLTFSLLLIYMVSTCLIVVVASIVGDLVESQFKRQAGIKDSSQLLPGHGGVLDRIDSLTAALPVYTACTCLFFSLRLSTL